MASGFRPDILIVDDNIAGALTLAMLLEMNGYSVLTTPSGKEAITMVEAHHPRVVLLDLGLPDMNGVDVARTLRESHNSERPMIVVLSGGDVDIPQSTHISELFDHYLAKPVLFEDLQAVLPSPSTAERPT
jgi:CheY-like chemotaxis protein